MTFKFFIAVVKASLRSYRKILSQRRSRDLDSVNFRLSSGFLKENVTTATNACWRGWGAYSCAKPFVVLVVRLSFPPWCFGACIRESRPCLINAWGSTFSDVAGSLAIFDDSTCHWGRCVGSVLYTSLSEISVAAWVTVRNQCIVLELQIFYCLSE